MTRITRLEVIDENGRSYVSWEDDNDVSWQFQDGGRTLKVFVNKVKPKSPVEEAYKEWMGKYPPTTPSVSNFDDNMWSAFQKGYTSAKEDYKVEEPTKPVNEVLDRLENKYENDEVVNRMLKKWEENPPEFLKFELGRSLEALITRWWCDVFTTHEDWDMETAIDDLIDQIQLWLPKEQDSSGTQSASVIDLVDGYNDALTKIKSKLRNKK
jgi:ribosome-associated translation inhibitor RaiA